MGNKICMKLFLTALLVTLFAFEFKFVAVGDLVTGNTYGAKSLVSETKKIKLPSLAKKILNSGDLTFCNLEGAITEHETSTKKANGRTVFAFRMPLWTPDFLFEAGFDVVSLANNHSLDFGIIGLRDTRKFLKEKNIRYADRYSKPAEFNVSGKRIGLIAYSFGPPPRSIVYEKSAIKEIRELSNKYDILIVSVHNGAEGPAAAHISDTFEYYLGQPRGNVYRFAHKAIDAGADLIIGHGPHVPRALEVYSNRLIIYSLGNFVTRGMNVRGIRGYAPIVEVVVDEQGSFVKGHIYSFIQVWPGKIEVDKDNRALNLIKDLTIEDIGENNIIFRENGEFYPGRG